jgi:hypothetical protein
MFKKLLPVFGALALFGLAFLFRTLDVAPAHGAATCTAGIRGVAESLA